MRELAEQLRSETGIAHLQSRVDHYLGEALAPSTRRAYKSDWDRWASFCDSLAQPSMPAQPQVVAVFAAALADQGKAVATIERALSAISKAHELQGFESPCTHTGVKLAMKGIRRELGIAQQQVEAITPEQLRDMVSALPHGEYHRELRAQRDHALLVVGFAGAFRRSELVQLSMDDLEETDNGFVLTLRRSKTDQEGRGRVIGVPYGSELLTCPARQLQKWLEYRTEAEGYLFCSITPDGLCSVLDKAMTPRNVARIVQRTALAAGIKGWVAGHSLRAGLVTAAAKAKKPIHSITAQTGHKSVEMVMRYIRRIDLWDDNAAANIGL